MSGLVTGSKKFGCSCACNDPKRYGRIADVRRRMANIVRWRNLPPSSFVQFLDDINGYTRN